MPTATKPQANSKRSCRTSLTLEKDVKEQAAELLDKWGMDMSTCVNIILKEMVRTGRFPASLELYQKPVRIADMKSSDKADRAEFAVRARSYLPQVREQRGYVISFDPELKKPVKVYQDGRKEACE